MTTRFQFCTFSRNNIVEFVQFYNYNIFDNAWLRASGRIDPARVTPKKRGGVQLQSGGRTSISFSAGCMGACAATHSGCSSGCMQRVRNRACARPQRGSLLHLLLAGLAGQAPSHTHLGPQASMSCCPLLPST
jgi:hypothetical protein